MKKSEDCRVTAISGTACRLCLADKPLEDSHIIPEFMFAALYDNKHRMFSFHSGSEGGVTYHQKGIREKLLCRDCESRLSPLEKYAKEVIYGNEQVQVEEAGREIVVRGLDYSRFKLFQMSLLWRAGVSKNHFFSAVSLGPHEEQLRIRIHTLNPGQPTDYPCFIVAVLAEKAGLLDELIVQPSRVRLGDHRAYRLLAGGLLWHFVVANPAHPIRYVDKAISLDGSISIPLVDVTEIRSVTNVAKKLAMSGKLDRIKKALPDSRT